MSNLFIEKVNPDWNFAFAYTPVFEKQSKYQKITIIETSRFGKVLLLDDVVQCTEADEFTYHEMLTHVPIIAHGDVRSVLIVGGGDGGMLEEVLKHKSIEHVTMVEIDEDVVTLSKQYLHSISNNAFDDPRVTLVIDDAVQWIKECQDKFDVIIIDRPDPTGPAIALYETKFYHSCRTVMNKQGILVAQGGVAFLNINGVAEQLMSASMAFRKASYYVTCTPSYIGGFMSLMWAADWTIVNVPREIIVNRIAEANIRDLQYYNANIHQACFALPEFIAKL
jgi:spermidine synthase